MPAITLHRPALDELAFRRELLADPETMAYNHAYGGAIDFPQERWADWYARWVDCGTGERFYRYLQAGEQFVGEAAYHFDSELAVYLCDVIVMAKFRGQGFGAQGLALLCEAAERNGVRRICDHIALDNPSAALFYKAGFREVSRDAEGVLVAKDL